MFTNPHAAPVQEISDPLLKKYGIRLLIKREDLIHPEISGNKWRKLKYNLLKAKNEGHTKILTFGGAYSNHLYATAAASYEFGFESIGIIRGEETLPLNHTLGFASKKGMKLFYMSRQTYRNKSDEALQAELRSAFGNFYLVPEGGTNALAVKGCTEILREVSLPYDIICCSVGTGGTIAGIIEGLEGEKKVVGFSALKGDFLSQTVKALLAQYSGRNYGNWKISNDYHFGGYGKITTELLDFIGAFYTKHHILLDPIYTGKMMFGMYDRIKKGCFPAGTTLLAIHTGGLQGWHGIRERFSSKYDLSFLDA